MASDTDYAWAAGIIDGEGCIALNKSTKRKYTAFTPRISVSNTDAKMLLRLKEIFGGSIHRLSSNHLGKKPIWQWVIVQEAALCAAGCMLLYMTTKREQAESLISFRLLKRKRGGAKNPHGIVDELTEFSNQILLKKQYALFEHLKAMKKQPSQLLQ